MQGRFFITSHPVLRSRRQKVLHRSEWYPAPVPHLDLTVTDLFEAPTGWQRALAEDGVAALQLDRLLDDDEFIRFGQLLGDPMTEIAEATRPFVDREVILDLRSNLLPTADPELQPFASGELTFHSEGSRRPLGSQPRFLVLACRAAGRTGSGAQTLVRRMSDVADALSERQLALLEDTGYAVDDAAPLSYQIDGRRAFSFRDFGDESLDWRYHGDRRVEPADVNAAIAGLLDAIYRPEAIEGVHWQRGLVMILDNTAMFHARSAAPVSEPGRRHLRRLRIRTSAS